MKFRQAKVVGDGLEVETEWPVGSGYQLRIYRFLPRRVAMILDVYVPHFHFRKEGDGLKEETILIRLRILEEWVSETGGGGQNRYEYLSCKRQGDRFKIEKRDDGLEFWDTFIPSRALGEP